MTKDRAIYLSNLDSLSLFGVHPLSFLRSDVIESPNGRRADVTERSNT